MSLAALFLLIYFDLIYVIIVLVIFPPFPLIFAFSSLIAFISLFSFLPFPLSVRHFIVALSKHSTVNGTA
jgi:hypothetical protein